MVAELIPKVLSTPIFLARTRNLKDIFENLTPAQINWAQEQDFSAKYGQILKLPDEEGNLDAVLFGLGNDREQARDRLLCGRLPNALPVGNYHFIGDDVDMEMAATAWLLSSYRFDRYKSNPKGFPKLVRPDDVDYDKINVVAQSAHLAMDMINRPANDLTPAALEEEVQKLAAQEGAVVESIAGAQLGLRNFPMVHAVGRASANTPRLIELKWGDEKNPKVTLVGKGVCFDTGGLDIKPSSNMRLMKKDMGGAANAIALALMIMRTNMPVYLRLLIPAVENSISAEAFRPGDILTARNGLTVEVNNTDAEGRLILADALSFGAEDHPDLMISLATLTGAARVAVGPDLVPFFTDDEEFAQGVAKAAVAKEDPLWRMPFWAPYESMIEPENADLDNAPLGGMAGAITAALFLRRFAGRTKYAHFDLFGWSPEEKAGRPKGGAVQAVRAIFAYLEERYGDNGS